jgi:hypothetical protein
VASAVLAPGAAQQNLDFELAAVPSEMPPGWTLFGGGSQSAAEIGIDSGSAAAGQHSLRITRASAAGASRVAQQLTVAQLGAAADGGRVRLRGSIRVAGAPADAASLWLRIAGEKGILYVDSRGDGRDPGPALAAPAQAEDARETSTRWVRYELELPVPADAQEIAFGVMLRGAGSAWFDAFELGAVDAQALPPPSAAAVRYVDAAVAIMQQHSLNRARVDWPSLRAQTLLHARGAVVPADAHLALRYALRELGDRHSYLQTPRAAGALLTTAVSNARTGQAPIAPQGEVLEGQFGYLSVPGFAGGSAERQVAFAERLKEIIESSDITSTCAWILDLRSNSGGNLWPMLAGVGPLLGDGDGDGEIGGSVYPDGRRVAVWYRDGRAGFGDYVQLRVTMPYRLRAKWPPVAVLIGPATASSGEVLAAAFRGRPNSLSFGAPTRGLSAGNRTFTLSDGAALILTVAATSDRTGRTYLGPLEPDRAIRRQGGDDDGSGDAVLDAALQWLRAQAACSGS